ncbi:MAG: hypothetical protein HYT87_16725 [Nitrospirae bacterium]|nr:hypothetical protein [Nitrospirota bacterium]
MILPTLASDDSTVTVRHPNYLGAFDLKTRSGHASVSPTFPSFSSLVRGFLATALPLDSGLILHAAAISLKGSDGTVVFAGASGSGKTTTARHFLKTRTRYVILSDELVAVRLNPKPRAFGTPFWGDLRSSIDPSKSRNNLSAPLRKLIFLEKGSRDERRPLTQRETAGRLLKCTLLHSRSKTVLSGALSTAQAMAGSCPAELLTWKSLDYLTATAGKLVEERAPAGRRVRAFS